MTLLPLLLTMATLPSADVDFFIGTYTSPGGSDGIYRASLNTDTGVLSAPTFVIKSDNPSFLTLRPDGRFLYAVNEVDNGMVSAYEVGADRSLRFLNAQSTKGKAPCHLSLDHAAKNLFVSNYTSGSLASFPVQADGTLAAASTFIQNEGKGPNKGRQEGPHMHSAYADAHDKFVYVCDLGTDEVLVFRLDVAKGKLGLVLPTAKAPSGGGPRHLFLSPDGRFVYANNELSNSVTVFRNDSATGALEPIQTISTMPEGDKTPSHTAEIVCHPNGKWLYVSNRGHESIAAYEIRPDGTLTLLEIQKAGVSEPRGVEIDPTGKWMVIGGQNSNDITTMAIDQTTGKLTVGPNKVALSKPVSIVFCRP